MARYFFERECRTVQSECYTVLMDSEPIGRIDVHFAELVIHASLSIVEGLTTEDIQDLIDTIDHELLDSVGISRQEVIVHVHQGSVLGVFTTRDCESNGRDDRLS